MVTLSSKYVRIRPPRLFSFSIMRKLTPSDWRTVAQDSPAIPPPMMITSYFCSTIRRPTPLKYPLNVLKPMIAHSQVEVKAACGLNFRTTSFVSFLRHYTTACRDRSCDTRSGPELVSRRHFSVCRCADRAASHSSLVLFFIFLQATIRRRMVASLYLRLRSRARYWRRSRSVRARMSLSRSTAHSKMSCRSPQGVGKVDGRLSDLRGIWRVGAGAARPRRDDGWCL